MPLQPGDTLLNGQYRVERLLGRGGFGFVYLAVHAVLGEQVAVKELIPALTADEEILKRFLVEARATMYLTHKRIVRTHDVFAEGGNYYIAMEFLPGGSLEQKLREQERLSVEQAAQIAVDVCEALAAAHEEGIVHCDLKPANILFDAGGRAKLADFGIAHVPADVFSRSRLTPSGFVSGTVPYMSPEQAEGMRDDPRSDLYALGATLYRMLTGGTYLDFEPKDTLGAQMRNAQRIKEQPPARPSAHNPTIPAWLDSTIIKALAKRPEERFDSALDMAGAFHAAAERGELPHSPAHRVPECEKEWLVRPRLWHGPPGQTTPRGGRQPVAPAEKRRARRRPRPRLLRRVLRPVWVPLASHRAPRPSLPPAGTRVSPRGAPLPAPAGAPAGGNSRGGRRAVVSLPTVALVPLAALGVVVLALLLRGLLASPGPGAIAVLSPTPAQEITAAPVASATPPASPTLPGSGLPPPGLQPGGGLLISPADRTATAEARGAAPTPTLVPTSTATASRTPRPAPTDTPEPPPDPPTRTPRPTATPTREPPERPTRTPTPTRTPDTGTLVSRTTRLPASAWQGRWVRPNGDTTYAGRDAAWIYGTYTNFQTMKATFQVSGQPVGKGELKIDGMDSEDAKKTAITIRVNGRDIFNGSNPLPDDDQPLETGRWGSYTWTFDATLLGSGANEISITNRSPGNVSVPPWFMLDWADVTYTVRE